MHLKFGWYVFVPILIVLRSHVRILNLRKLLVTTVVVITIRTETFNESSSSAHGNSRAKM